MLQWMGGSRRKVTTSRKSTQKRQKQYFEQRRRQQHQQEASDGGNYSEGNRTCVQRSENSRSLDVLSLLNLSAVAQEHNSSCAIAREKPENDGLNYQPVQHLSVVQSHEANTQDHCEIGEAGTSTSYQMGITYPKRIPVSASGNHAETLKADGEKMNQFKMSPDYQLSMIDILEDDEPISSGRNSLAQEAHVAFSIEGLGKVETETPVHSPVTHSRRFLDGCSSPSKATKRANSSGDIMSEMVNLEYGLDAMMRDVDIAFCRSSLEQPFCSKKRVDSFSQLEQKFGFKEFSLFNDDDNSLHDLLGDDEIAFGIKDRNQATCNDPGIQADNILDKCGFHLSGNNWMDPIWKSTDFLSSMDYRKKYSTFEGFGQQEKRTTMRKGGKLESIETPVPNFKYQKLENVSYFELPDMTWHSSIGSDHDFSDLKDEFVESCFISEDARESSLPSEESCSSTAVRGKLERTLLNLKDKHAMRDSNDICHSESVYSEKDISPRERSSRKWNTSFKGHMDGPGKFTRMSNPSRSTEIPQLHATSRKRLKPNHSKYFEAEYNLEEQSSGCNSFSETSGTSKHVSSGCTLWTGDPFHTTGDTKLESSRSRSERFNKSSARCSPCCNFISDTHDFCQPNLQNTSGSSMQNIFQVSTPGQKSQKSLDVDGSGKENNDRQSKENSGVQVSDRGRFQFKRDELRGSDSLSSENVKSTGASHFEVKYSNSKERTCGTPNTGDSGNKTNQAEDMPSLETSNISDTKQLNADRKCQFAQTALSCQTGSGDIEEEDPQPIQKTRGSDIQNPTCQVMMFDSCVMQLLCVQVLKEVYPMVTGKQPLE